MMKRFHFHNIVVLKYPEVKDISCAKRISSLLLTSVGGMDVRVDIYRI